MPGSELDSLPSESKSTTWCPDMRRSVTSSTVPDVGRWSVVSSPSGSTSGRARDGRLLGAGEQRAPGVGADEPVDLEPVRLLEGAHRLGGRRSEVAVDQEAGSDRLAQPLLH